MRRCAIESRSRRVKVAVLPLIKNKEALVGRARDLYKKLQRRYAVFYDDGGNIGKRYRRQDEIGTPLCITVDYQTAQDGTVTVRERDTMTQERVPEDRLLQLLDDRILGT